MLYNHCGLLCKRACNPNSKSFQYAPTRKTIVQANLRLMQFIITGRRRILLRRITRRYLIISPTRINKDFRLLHRHTVSFYKTKKSGGTGLPLPNRPPSPVSQGHLSVLRA